MGESKDDEDTVIAWRGLQRSTGSMLYGLNWESDLEEVALPWASKDGQALHGSK